MKQLGKIINPGLAIALFLLTISCASGPSVEETALFYSFEQIKNGQPEGWEKAAYGSKATLALADQGRSGNHSLMITSLDGADAGWRARVSVRPYSRYRLEAWIKTENVDPGSGKGALLNIHNIQPLQTGAVTGTMDWARVNLEFDTEANDVILINCLFGGWGRATGRAWYDDVSLQLISSRALDPQVTIIPAETRAPLSKYIYGQFIEHLGRCIYGGIWAEMIEDRKFYYKIGSRNSPWETLKNAASVRMTGEDPFVGEHCPEIPAKSAGRFSGIVQADLGLAPRSEYVGRIVLSGPGGGGPVDVTLKWGDGPEQKRMVTIEKIGREYRSHPLHYRTGENSGQGQLMVINRGSGLIKVGTLSLMPADNIDGFRADVLELLKQLNSPVYRWPGGNFVSGYNWRDGIGPRDRRPPRKNPAWKGVEHNDVGVHEFINLCRLINSEPFIAVNSGLGGAGAAAEQVEYVNGDSRSPMGRLRAANGHSEPFDCKWWSIGNEMYGGWQLGHMPVKDYTDKHNQFARVMREKDPSIRLIAVGAVGPWDEAMLSACSDSMDLISEHFYCQESPGLLGHVNQIPRQIRRIATAHRGYRKSMAALQGKDIRIALDEWNYWYGPHVYGELGTRYFLKDALGIAAGIHEYSRQSDIIFMANYAQTVNVIGAIKTSKTAAQFATTGLVLKLYRQHFGSIPVELSGQPEPLDVAAAWTGDKEALIVAVVNPTLENQPLKVELQDSGSFTKGRFWRISGGDAQLYNEPGREKAVAIVEGWFSQSLATIDIPPLSITLYELKRE